MLKYENLGHAIKINLPKEAGYEGYSIECQYLYDKQTEKYLLTMWLSRADIDDRFHITGQKIDSQYISGTRETIRANICRIVQQACLSGFYAPYIERFEYTYSCFDLGNDILEKEGFLS